MTDVIIALAIGIPIGAVIGWLAHGVADASAHGEADPNVLPDEMRRSARATRDTLKQHASKRPDEAGSP